LAARATCGHKKEGCSKLGHSGHKMQKSRCSCSVAADASSDEDDESSKLRDSEFKGKQRSKSGGKKKPKRWVLQHTHT